MRERILVIYHRVDFDGIFSGDTVKKFGLDRLGYEPDMFGYNYGDDIPNLDLIRSYDRVVLVDISFPPDYMKVLWNIEQSIPGTITWIDHHITAIENSISGEYDNLPGLREVGTAACELTWKYFYPDIPVPNVIQHLGAYDVWDRTRFDWKNETLPLQSAIRVKYGNGEHYIWPIFNELITLEDNKLEELYEVGRLLNKADAIRFKSDVERFGFPIKVAEKYNGIAILGTSFTSIVFDSVADKYDIYCVINRRRKKIKDTEDQYQFFYQLSLYSEPGRTDLCLGKYLVGKFGDNAGGHDSAAGATISEEAFYELLNNGTI